MRPGREPCDYCGAYGPLSTIKHDLGALGVLTVHFCADCKKIADRAEKRAMGHVDVDVDGATLHNRCKPGAEEAAAAALAALRERQAER